MGEIPIDYFARTGESKLSRFGDAWRHVRFMLLYSPSWLYFVPGGALLLLGLAGMLVLASGPVDVLGRTWQIHTMLAFVALTLIGAQVVQLGVFARTYALTHFGEHDPLLDRLRRRMHLEHGLLFGLALVLAGAGVLIAIVVRWANAGFGALGRRVSDRTRSDAHRPRRPDDLRLVLPRTADDALRRDPDERLRAGRRCRPCAGACDARLVRVCLVYDHLFPQTVGGVERWFRDLALRLAELDHEVTYLTMRHWEREPLRLCRACASSA